MIADCDIDAGRCGNPRDNRGIRASTQDSLRSGGSARGQSSRHLTAVTVRACATFLGRSLPRHCAPHAPRRLRRAAARPARFVRHRAPLRHARRASRVCAAAAPLHVLLSTAAATRRSAFQRPCAPHRRCFPHPHSPNVCVLRITTVAWARGAIAATLHNVPFCARLRRVRSRRRAG